jgi:azurin
VGHDPLAITRAVVIDQHQLFLELPDLQPVNQLHLRLQVNHRTRYPSTNPIGFGHDLFLTVHQLDHDFRDFADYSPVDKVVAAHPLLVDLSTAAKMKPNPWLKPIGDKGRRIEVVTGKNLTFQQTEISVKAGEAIELVLSNPDVVPHNWVLVQPNQLQTVGELANQLIAKPEAFAMHYVPDSPQVIAHTDVVQPDQQQSIYFSAPEKAGRYPYLCTFPGHWMVMNGTLIVER